MSVEPKKLMVQVAETMQTRHYSVSTQKTYRYWITRPITTPRILSCYLGDAITQDKTAPGARQNHLLTACPPKTILRVIVTLRGSRDSLIRIPQARAYG